MLNTTTAYSTTTGPVSSDGASTSPPPAPFDNRGSQSKLREILRDQSRREEQQSTPATTSLPRQTAPLCSAPNLSSSASGYLGPASVSPGHREAALPHIGAAGGGGSSESNSTMVDMYASNQTGVASHLSRQRSTRQQGHYAADALKPAPEITPGGTSSNLSRSQSTAGLSNGLDLKVVILGAQGVGKTSLVHRYTSGHFSASAVPSTIGASFLTKKLIVDGVKVRLQLWDTAGQERFRSMAPMYYRGSNAAVIVYDITNPSSFEDVKTWIDELRKNVHSDLVIHIVGSKVDLAPHSRKVNLEEAREEVLSWTTPPQAKLNEQSTPSVRSRSAFGAFRGINTMSGTGASALHPGPGHPTSPSFSSGTSSSRLTGFGSLAGLGSKHSKITLSPSSKEIEEDGGEGDAHSSPSTASSHGGGGCAERSKQEEWDSIDVSEVSSKDNEGIEDVFVGIATRLVERKEEMEELARKRQDRKSVFLSEGGEGEHQGSEEARASWCCAS